MRVLSQLISSKRRSYDAARGTAAALVSMQAARLLPGWTRNAPEPTARPNAAATSADTDEHGRACVGGVGGVGPYVLRLEDQSQHQQQPAHMRRAVCMRRVHHLQAQADDVTALWSAALTASGRADRLWR